MRQDIRRGLIGRITFAEKTGRNTIFDHAGIQGNSITGRGNDLVKVSRWSVLQVLWNSMEANVPGVENSRLERYQQKGNRATGHVELCWLRTGSFPLEETGSHGRLLFNVRVGSYCLSYVETDE